MVVPIAPLAVIVRLCRPTVGRRCQLRSVLSVTPWHQLVEARELVICDAAESVGEGGPVRHRAVAPPLQHRPTPQRIGLETTRPRSHRQSGPEAGHALTIKLDHSVGADQHH